MSDGGCVEIRGGNSAGAGMGGNITISAGDSNTEKELIENNPCWPYSAPNKLLKWEFVDISIITDPISELDISGPTAEEYLASLETVQNDELKIHGGGEITFAAGETLTYSNNGDWVTKDYVDSIAPKLEAGPGLQINDHDGNQMISLDETIQVQHGTAYNPPYTFGEDTHSGMFHTSSGIGFAVNGSTKVEIDSYYGLLLQTPYGEIDVATELKEAKEKIHHLMNENVILRDRLYCLEARLSFLETNQPWKDFV
jgi:hypothetical protein